MGRQCFLTGLCLFTIKSHLTWYIGPHCTYPPSPLPFPPGHGTWVHIPPLSPKQWDLLTISPSHCRSSPILEMRHSHWRPFKLEDLPNRYLHLVMATETRTVGERMVRIRLEGFHGYFLQPANKFCEGYVFTRVCLSTGGVCLSAWWDTPWQGRPLLARQTPAGKTDPPPPARQIPP